MTQTNIHTPQTALVIGATGGVGGAVANQLLVRGWRVNALNRDPERVAQASRLSGLTWIKGDAMNAADVLAAAKGASLIVHAANPPGYRNWGKVVLPMLDSSIAAAKATGARLLLPSTVYNYGEDAGAVITETSPQNPITRKGEIRAEMERRLKASGVKTLIVRAGDFFGPGATANSWFSQFIKPGKPVRSVTYPGVRSIGHAWAYLPDLGETMMKLLEREADLETFAVFNFGGHWFERGVELAEAVRRVAEQPKAPIRSFPWFLVYGLAPFVTTMREMLEMRYLWKRPIRLDNAKLVAFLGAEPHTPTDRAVAVALDTLGCLKAEWQLRTTEPVAV